MKITSHTTRFSALALGAALLSSAFVGARPTQAADSKSWKYGAIGLGALGAYALSKGKNVEGAAALGGAYYAYKKSQSDRNQEKRAQNFRRFDNWRAENRRNNDWRSNDWRGNDSRSGLWRANERRDYKSREDCDDD